MPKHALWQHGQVTRRTNAEREPKMRVRTRGVVTGLVIADGEPRATGWRAKGVWKPRVVSASSTIASTKARRGSPPRAFGRFASKVACTLGEWISHTWP
jgi:hypothetical protein